MVNYKLAPEQLTAKVKEAMAHIDFALKLCEIQAMAGRLFMFEHRVSAASWNLSLVKRMFKFKKVVTVDFDFCRLGMHYKGYPAKKRTRIMTNSPCIANRLAKFQCPGDHEHIPLINGRAGPCQIYPRKFCSQICIGLKEELAGRAIGSLARDYVDPIKELLSVYPGPAPGQSSACHTITGN